MIAKTWIVLGAALAGSALATVATAPAAHAKKKKKTSISCKTDGFGKFKTNKLQGADPLGAVYSPIIDRLEIVGGSGRVTGTGPKTTSTSRAFAIVAIIPDLETRTDFPVSVQANTTTMTNIVTKGLNVPVTDSWIGNDMDVGHTVELTVTGISNGKISATFSGAVPVVAGTKGPLNITKGKAYAPLVIE